MGSWIDKKEAIRRSPLYETGAIDSNTSSSHDDIATASTRIFSRRSSNRDVARYERAVRLRR